MIERIDDAMRFQKLNNGMWVDPNTLAPSKEAVSAAAKVLSELVVSVATPRAHPTLADSERKHYATQ